MYTWSDEERTSIRREVDGACIPCVPGNSDYDRIAKEGLLDQIPPYEAPAPAITTPSLEEQIAELKAIVAALQKG